MDKNIRVRVSKDLNYEEGKFNYHIISIINISSQEKLSIESYGQYINSNLEFTTKSVDMGSSFDLFLETNLEVDLSEWISNEEIEKTIISKHLKEVESFIKQLDQTQLLYQNEYKKRIEIEDSLNNLIKKYE